MPLTPSPGDGFLAGVRIVDDPAYAGLAPDQLVALVPETAPEECLFVVDQTALTHDAAPILVVPRVPADWDEELRSYVGDRTQFRVAVAHLWGVENNLRLANMDWADSTDADGIHRGF